MKTKLHIILIFFGLGFLCACDTDQIEYKFNDYTSANERGIFETRWIPNEVISSDMTEIYLRTNLDLNNCFFSFYTSKEKIDSIQKLLTKQKSAFNKPHRLNVSNKLIKQSEKLDFYLLKRVDIKDSVYIAADIDEKMIFGLRL